MCICFGVEKSQASECEKKKRCKHFPFLQFFTDYCQVPSTPKPTTAVSGMHSCPHICGSYTVQGPSAGDTVRLNNTINARLLFWHFQETAAKSTCLTLAPSPAPTTQATTTTPPTVPGSSECNMAKKSSCPSHLWSEKTTTPILAPLIQCDGSKILDCFCFYPFFETRLEDCCSCDYIAIYDGSYVGAPFLGKVCNKNATSFQSSSNYLTVLFRTDSSVVGRGFKAEFSSSLPASSGTIEELKVGQKSVIDKSCREISPD